MKNEFINGCGHTQTNITKYIDRIEKERDWAEFNFLKRFLYEKLKKNLKKD